MSTVAPAADHPGLRLFQVLYGSHAHGTATPSSDHDWRGVYMLRNDAFLGLTRPLLTWEDKAQDQVFWEIGQFCRLLLKGNPNLVGMLWTPSDCIHDFDSAFTSLWDERRRFIHQGTVQAYLGWAHREMREVAEHGARVTSKRLSHVPRLLWEVAGAVLNGDIPVRLPGHQLEVVMAIKTGEMSHAEAVRFITTLLVNTERLAAGHPQGPPPTDWTNEWLLGIRRP